MQHRFSLQSLLWLFMLFIGMLIAGRILYIGQRQFLFLIWNIFLAWLPYYISSFLKNKFLKRWKSVFLVIIWFSLFPNALYIVTDFVHLRPQIDIPMWYDAILLFSSSIIGLILAFASLWNVEKFLVSIFSKKMVNYLEFAFIFFGSFGVYLGRFLRWNSWDIISDPISLLSSIVSRIIYPLDHMRTWGLTLILTTLFYLLYNIGSAGARTGRNHHSPT
jgi:uncharacterized membrane protein